MRSPLHALLSMFNKVLQERRRGGLNPKQAERRSAGVREKYALWEVS